MPDPYDHWEGVYGAKVPTDVSWFQERPEVSLALIGRSDVVAESSILDVGGGASTLADHLLDAGHSALTVLDLSSNALEHARARLGQRAKLVDWIAADITAWRPQRSYHLWHDRAVLHFLTDTEGQAAYARVLKEAVRSDGWVVIAGFAPGGPLKCSGLDIVQHDAATLQALLGADFELQEVRDELHNTPWQSEQKFRYHLFRRLENSDG
jgi:2-polyprenyl-3-methyl-5-hydroxy-6-metoxy-1,4-benzoquinol methylase